MAWATVDGSATAGSDYTAASGTVTFSAGTTTQPIAIAVAGDLLDEDDEHFYVSLSSASGATIAVGGPGLGMIVDDDASPSLSVSDAAATAEGDCGTTDATFAVAVARQRTDGDGRLRHGRRDGAGRARLPGRVRRR